MRASRRRHGLHAEVDPARLLSCARPAGAEGRASQWSQKINQEADVFAHFKAVDSLNDGGLARTADHAVGERLELLSDTLRIKWFYHRLRRLPKRFQCRAVRKGYHKACTTASGRTAIVELWFMVRLDLWD